MAQFEITIRYEISNHAPTIQEQQSQLVSGLQQSLLQQPNEDFRVKIKLQG